MSKNSKVLAVVDNMQELKSIKDQEEDLRKSAQKSSARNQNNLETKSLYQINREGPPNDFPGDIMDQNIEPIINSARIQSQRVPQNEGGPAVASMKYRESEIEIQQNERDSIRTLYSPAFKIGQKKLQMNKKICQVEVRHPEMFKIRGSIKRKIVIFFHILNACVGSFLFGYYLVSFNSISGQFIVQNGWYQRRTWAIYDAFITAAFPLGALFVTQFMWSPRDKLFQNYRILFLTLDFCTIVVGIGMMSSTSPVIMLTSRFLMGSVLAMNTNVIPTYIRELSQNILPDIIFQLNQFGVSLGMFFCTVLSYWQLRYVTQVNEKRQDEFIWRTVLTFPLLCTVGRSFFTFFILKKDIKNNITENIKTNQMANFYERLYQRTDYLNTLQQFIQEEEIDGLRDERVKKGFKHQDTFNPFEQSFLRRALLVIIIALGGQITGFNAFNMHSVTIYADYDPRRAIQKQSTNANVSLVAHFLALIILQFFQKWRKVFLVGVAIMIIPLYIIIYFDQDRNATGILWAAAVYFCGYWISYGYLENEFLKQYINLRGLYIFLFTQYLGMFTVALITPPMLYQIYIGGAFGIYASITIILALYVAVETKYTAGLSQYKIALSYLFEDQKPQLIDPQTDDPQYGEFDYQSKLDYLKYHWQQAFLEKSNAARIGFPLNKTIKKEL